MNKSVKDTLRVTSLMAPVAVTADAETTGVDASKGESLQIAVNVGDFEFSGVNSLSLRLQHADVDAGGSYAAVTDADVYETIGSNGEFAMLDSTDDAETVTLANYKGNKKYVRVAIVEAGTVSVPVSVMAFQSDLKAQGE